MTMLIIGTAVLLAGLVGVYLYLHGESLLDWVISEQKKIKGGFYRKLKKNARCPACGAKDSEKVYNAEIQKVVYGCNECNAAWPMNPIVPVQAWDFLGRDLKLSGERANDVREAFAIANAPIKLKSEKKEAA